jgi:quercetin dioxygenase-like cupin family protein
VTGLNDAGRSCVVRERDVAFGELAPGLSVDGLFKTHDSPPAAPPESGGAVVDLNVEPGQCSWALWRFEPGGEVAMHHTNTFDFDTVVDGSIELILEDGTYVLRPGDCVVMTGVDHAWRAGVDGCTVSAVALGTLPPT